MASIASTRAHHARGALSRPGLRPLYIIEVSTNTYDTRPGLAFGGVGCGENGCGPELTRDGIVGLESRWACSQQLDPNSGVCEIAFGFEDPQNIMEVQVEFFKERR